MKHQTRIILPVLSLFLTSCFQFENSQTTTGSQSSDKPGISEKEEITIDILNENSTLHLEEETRLEVQTSDSGQHGFLFTSTSPEVISVSDDGILRGLSLGHSTIYVSLKENEEISTSMDFIVIEKEEEPEKDGIENPDPSRYVLGFHDEFDGDALNEEYWSYQIGTGREYGIDGWGNQEAQSYQKENIYVRDGKLHITAKKESRDGREYTSGRIRTYQKVAFTYGRIDASIKLPAYPGLWPAFWMLPDDNTYGGWPNSGEIDIMEARGRVATESSAAVHMASISNQHTYSTGKYTFPQNQSISDFHTYSFIWEKNDMRFLVDNIEFLRLKENSLRNFMGTDGQPFDTNFYILFNLAVGGHFDNFTMPDDKTLPSTMEVDYVRWWTLK